jgi:glycosyltransferase involved in cell wall biosynthesis
LDDRPNVWWVNQFAKTPDLPGGTRHYEMSRVLAARGWSVTVVASDLNLTTRRYSRRTDSRDRRYLKESSGGVDLVWLPAGSYERNDWRRALSMLTFSWHAFRFLTQNVGRDDVVIGSSPHLLAGFGSWVAARTRRARFVLEVRDLWPESLVAVQGRQTLLSHALQPLANLLYRRSDSIVVLAKGSKEFLRNRGVVVDKIHWIPNGISEIPAEALEATLPDSLKWLRNEKVFVYAGAHGPANGLEILLDVAELLSVNSVPARILLVGDGPSKASLQRLAAARGIDRIIFHDPIEKSLIPIVLSHCIGGLMILKDAPLFQYGVSPNKLFDYLGAGLPVIANVPGGVAAMLEECDGGISVAPGDAQAISNAMQELLNNRRDRHSAKDYVRRNYSRDRLTDRLEGVLLTG